MKNKIELYIFIGIILGALFGLFLPETVLYYSFLGEIFLRGLKLLIVPLVFVSIIYAFSHINLRKARILGKFTGITYLISSCLAAITGILMANVMVYFVGNSPDSFTSPKVLKSITASDIILSFVPQNIFKSFVEGNIVHIVVIALFISMLLYKVSEAHSKKVYELNNALYELLLKAVHFVLYLAPVGIFALTASFIAQLEEGFYEKFFYLFLAITLAAFIHLFINLAFISHFLGKFNLFKYIIKIKRPALVALTTASSSATLPISISTAVEQAKIEKETANFVLPLGATLNMDGSALYQSIVVIFMAQIAQISLSMADQFLIFFFVMISSAGTAGVPAGGMLMIGSIMSILGIPSEYIALYLIVDRFWDYPITMINVIGDMIAAKVVNYHYIKGKK